MRLPRLSAESKFLLPETARAGPFRWAVANGGTVSETSDATGGTKWFRTGIAGRRAPGSWRSLRKFSLTADFGIPPASFAWSHPGHTPTVTTQQPDKSATTFRFTWMILTAGWGCLAVLYAVYLNLIAGDSLECPTPAGGNSSFGTAQWSWAHMGNKCTFTDASWLVPGESVSFYSDSAWTGVLGLICTAVTLLLLGFTGFRATRRAKL